MSPILGRNVVKDKTLPVGENPEHMSGAVSRVKGRVKAVFARFREHSSRRGRTPNRGTYQDQGGTLDDFSTLSTRAQLHPSPNLPRNLHFRSISPASGQPYATVQFLCKREVRDPIPGNRKAGDESLPDDTGDKSVLLRRRKDYCEKEAKPKSESSSYEGGELENRPVQELPQAEGTNLPQLPESMETRHSKNLQDSQSVPNFCPSFSPRHSLLDAEAYKSVLWEIKKQNDAFQESWRRLEVRLDRLENVLSNVYRRGEPTVEGEEETPWDFSQGFVVKEAESLDLIVDLSNNDNPVVAKQIYNYKGTVEPQVTAVKDEQFTVREWASIRPTSPENSKKNVGSSKYKSKLEEYLSEKETCGTQQSTVVQKATSRKWASLQHQQKEPQILQIERSIRATRLKDREKDQCLFWQPKSLQAWQEVSRRPSRKLSSRTSLPHLRRTVAGNELEGFENGTRSERMGRRRFRFDVNRDSVGQPSRSQNWDHVDNGSIIKKQMRKDSKQEKRGMKFKLPKWLSPRKRKGKKLARKSPDEEDEIYKGDGTLPESAETSTRLVETLPEPTETLPRPLETKIKILVNPDEKVYPRDADVNKDHHHIHEVDSVMKMMDDEVAVRKIEFSGGNPLVEREYEDQEERLDEENESGKVVDSGMKKKISLVAPPENEEEMEDDSTYLRDVAWQAEPAKPDDVFWFVGNKEPKSTKKKAVCGEIQPKTHHPGYYLSQFYGEHRTGGFYSSSKYRAAEFDQKAMTSRTSIKPLDERCTPTSEVPTGSTGFGPTTAQVAPKVKEFVEYDDEDDRRRKALKSRLRGLTTGRDSNPDKVRNLSGIGEHKVHTRPEQKPVSAAQTVSPASILRRRLDASPLRNQKVCQFSKIVFSDSVQINLNSRSGSDSEDQYSKVGHQYISNPNNPNDADNNHDLVSDAPVQAIADPKTGLLVCAQKDHVEIVLPKLSGKKFDRVLVEVEHTEAPEKITDEKCVPGLSKESDDTVNKLSPTTSVGEITEDKCCEGASGKSKGKSPKTRTEKGKSKHNVCSLKRLSSHSLEDLILKGCESADRVLNDRLDEEIAALGVPREECHERPTKEKFVDRLVRQLKTKRNDGTPRCRSRPVSIDLDDHYGDFQSTDRFQKDRRRHKLIQPVRTEPSHRYHFRESQANLNEGVRPNCLRPNRRRYRDRPPVLDADTTVLGHPPENDHPHKYKRNVRRRHRRVVHAGSSDSETRDRHRRKDSVNKVEEISGLITRAKRCGQTVETFKFNPLWAPSSHRLKKKVDSPDIISKLFPPLQTDSKPRSSLRIHSSLKLRTPDGITYHLDSDSLEKLSLSQSLKNTREKSSKQSFLNRLSQSPIDKRKSFKEEANKSIASKDSKKCLLDSSNQNHNELYTVFSEKIYFPSNHAEDSNLKPDSVHVETITISCPIPKREEGTGNLGDRSFGALRHCKKIFSSRGDELPRRSRRRTKLLSDIADYNLKMIASDSENDHRDKALRRRVKKREKMQR